MWQVHSATSCGGHVGGRLKTFFNSAWAKVAARVAKEFGLTSQSASKKVMAPRLQGGS